MQKQGISVVEINKEIYESGKRLINGCDKLFELSKEMAETEQKYRKALALEIIRLREEKVQATLVPDIARGNTSDLKFKRDLAESRYRSALNAMDAIKTQLSGLQSILKYQEEI